MPGVNMFLTRGHLKRKKNKKKCKRFSVRSLHPPPAQQQTGRQGSVKQRGRNTAPCVPRPPGQLERGSDSVCAAQISEEGMRGLMTVLFTARIPHTPRSASHALSASAWLPSSEARRLFAEGPEPVCLLQTSPSPVFAFDNAW